MKVLKNNLKRKKSFQLIKTKNNNNGNKNKDHKRNLELKPNLMNMNK
jgi:hypothetical protein